MTDPSLPTALVVNDHAPSRYLAAHSLRHAGFSVLEAANGEDGLALARKNRPDVMVLDVRLPGMDGVAVCRAVKGDEQTHGVIVLLTSATFTSTDKRVAGLESGADGYLVQPAEPIELLATVRALMRLRSTEHELRARTAQLAEQNRRRNDFLAMLAHELRNPLAAITHSLAQLAAPSEEDGRRSRLAALANEQTRHVAHLVDDLLDVSRVVNGKLELRREWLELGEYLAHFVDAAGELADRRGAVLVTDLEPILAWIHADPHRLSQVLTNLLDNAAKYGPPGGTIHLGARLERSGEACVCVLSVRDDGVGLDPEDQQRIFDLFVQLDVSLERAQGGLGIGLSLTKRLVEMHGGSISVSSEGRGKGSEFTVRLPVFGVPPVGLATVETSPGSRATPMRPLRILLVEDNAAVRESTQSLLEDWEHRVEAVGDGLAGVEAAIARCPDVAIVDLGLPGMDGFEVARRIRAALGSRLRLIAMSGYGGAEILERTRSAGFDQLLVKPVDVGELSRVLAAIGACLEPVAAGSSRN